MTLLTMQGEGHTGGIVACIGLALGNLTSYATPAPPPAATEPDQPAAYYNGVPPAPPAALVRWDGVLVVATLALLVTVGGWLLLHLVRCSFRHGVASCQPGGRGSAGKSAAVGTDTELDPTELDPTELDPASPRPAAPPPLDAPQPLAADSFRESGSDGATQPPSRLERAAGLLLRWAGPVCAVVLVAVLAPTVLQLLHVLRQEEIVDTELSSFRSVTGRYTDRQDAFWLLLQATMLLPFAANSSTAPTSGGPCVGVRGEACLAGWARVTVAVGGAPLHGGGDATWCETLSYEMLPCMRHWAAQPSYASLYDAMSACDAEMPSCVGVQYDGQGRYVPYGGEVTGAQGATLPSGQVGFLPPGAVQRRALRRDVERAPLPPPQPPPPPPPPTPPTPPPPTTRTTPWEEWVTPWEWMTPSSPLQDVRRRLSGGKDVTTVHVMYTMAGGRDEAGSKVRGDVLAPEVLARVREIEAEIAAFSGDYLTNLDSAVPCLLGRKGAAAAAAGGALAWYATEDEGEPSEANVRACVYGLLAAAKGSDHFGADLDATMRGGANVTCPALRSSLTFGGASDAWARRLIWKLYAISGRGGVEVSFHGDGKWFWTEFDANLMHDIGFVAASLAFIWLFTAFVLRMPLYATVALLVVVASFPVAFAFYSGPLGAEKAPLHLLSE